MKKLLFLGCILLCLSATVAPAQNTSPLVRIEKMPAQGCRSFVEDFYSWYRKPARRDLTHRPAGPRWVQSIKLRPKSFETTLLQQLQEENGAQSGMLPFDPILGSAHSDTWHRTYADTNVDGYHCTADYMATLNERSAGSVIVTAELHVVHAHWQFANFYYRQDDLMLANNLLEILKLRREARQGSRQP